MLTLNVTLARLIIVSKHFYYTTSKKDKLGTYSIWLIFEMCVSLSEFFIFKIYQLVLSMSPV